MHLPENAMGTSAFVVAICKMEKMKMHDVVVCWLRETFFSLNIVGFLFICVQEKSLVKCKPVSSVEEPKESTDFNKSTAPFF